MTFTKALMYLVLVVVEKMKLVVFVALSFALILNAYGSYLIKDIISK